MQKHTWAGRRQNLLTQQELVAVSWRAKPKFWLFNVQQREMAEWLHALGSLCQLRKIQLLASGKVVELRAETDALAL